MDPFEVVCEKGKTVIGRVCYIVTHQGKHKIGRQGVLNLLRFV